MVAVGLVTLALADAGLSGFRAAAGRNPLVFKAHYYRTAVLRGLSGGVVALTVIALVIGGLIFVAGDPAATYDTFVARGRRMLLVYVPFASVVAAAFALYLIESVDLRSLLSTAIFGPVTLIRPFVIVAGAGVAAIGAPLQVLLGSVVSVAVMLTIEPVVGRRYRDWLSSTE